MLDEFIYNNKHQKRVINLPKLRSFLLPLYADQLVSYTFMLNFSDIAHYWNFGPICTLNTLISSSESHQWVRGLCSVVLRWFLRGHLSTRVWPADHESGHILRCGSRGEYSSALPAVQQYNQGHLEMWWRGEWYCGKLFMFGFIRIK